MAFENGKTYRFVNRCYAGFALNVFGTKAASTGRNVCLYANDPTDIMQDWVVQERNGGYRLHSAVNQSYVLDCSDGSLKKSYKNNAHLCITGQTSDTDSRVIFEGKGNKIYKIYLPVKNLYLTATNSKVNKSTGYPASTIENESALIGGAGGESNVYWAPGNTRAVQEWIVSPDVDGGTTPPDPEPPVDPDDGVLTNDVTVSMPANTYLSQLDESTWAGLSGIDDTCPMANRKSSGCGAAAATMVARIMENNSAITTKNLYDWGLWKVSDEGYPWMNWTQNSSSPLTFTFSGPVKNWESAKGIIFDEIVNNRPVVIYLENTAKGGMHFVVGYGLKAGASRNNLQDSKIMVLNSYPIAGVAEKFGTLADMKSFTKWQNFGSVRKAVKR